MDINTFVQIASAEPVEAVKTAGPAGGEFLPEQAGSSTAAAVRELRLEFRGSAREYFRIWAVNLCLTLLTLGIFSAWAKVRKKRYFYSHTVLDGTPLQYLGQPLVDCFVRG